MPPSELSTSSAQLMSDKITPEMPSYIEMRKRSRNAAKAPAAVNQAKLRSSLNGHFGTRLESTGDRQSTEQTFVIFQTLGASPENPYIVTLDQFILDPFTGPGQFDLMERDSVRRAFDGVSAGGTPVLGSEEMNFQPGDEGKIIKVGAHPGRYYGILSVDDDSVTLDGNITLPSIELTLEMEGESEVTIATKSGLTNGAITGGWSRLVKVITADKVYSVVFVPGTAGDGIYSIKAQALYGGSIDPDQTPLPT